MRNFIFSSARDREEQSGFFKFIAVSFSFHFFIAVVLFFAANFMNTKSTMDLPAIEAKLVRFGTKERDKSFLPRIYEKTQPKTVSKDSGTGNSVKNIDESEEKKPEKVDKKERKDINLDELLGKAAINDIKKDARAEKSDEGSKDGAKDGDVVDSAFAVKGNMYIRQLNKLIRQNWKIPSIISEASLKGLNTEIFFRITFNGEVYDISVISSSGNKVFDSSVIEAIKKTTKVPLPDDKKLKKFVLKEGLQWNFSPEQ